jgi:thioesterase domain-containing protein
MQPTTIVLVLQTISSLSIAGGLIFAAVQFRHGRKATHVANFTRLVELQMQLRRMRVDDPSLAAVYRHDMTGLQTDEQVRQYFFNLMQLSLFEIAWYSHRHGQLPDDYWQSWVDRMKTIQVEESFRQMMASPAMKILHNDFQKYVVDLMGQTAPSPALRESQRDVPVPPR